MGERRGGEEVMLIAGGAVDSSAENSPARMRGLGVGECGVGDWVPLAFSLKSLELRDLE